MSLTFNSPLPNSPTFTHLHVPSRTFAYLHAPSHIFTHIHTHTSLPFRLNRQCNNTSNKCRRALEQLHETEQLVISSAASCRHASLNTTDNDTDDVTTPPHPHCSSTLPRSRPSQLYQLNRDRQYRHSASVDQPKSLKTGSRVADHGGVAMPTSATLPQRRLGSLNTRSTLPRSTSTPVHLNPTLTSGASRVNGPAAMPGSCSVCGSSSDSVDSFATADGSSHSSCEMYTPPPHQPRHQACNGYPTLRPRHESLQACGSCNSLPMRLVTIVTMVTKLLL